MNFEDFIIEYLDRHGWLIGESSHYDRELALYPEDVFGWLEDTQPEKLNGNQGLNDVNEQNALLKRMIKVMDREGSLSVLRHGFKDISKQFDMCQFRPSQTMNEKILDMYNNVRLRAVRQLHYSLNNNNSIDIVLFVNGIPIATMELKSDFTQSVNDAKEEYKQQRLPKDPKTRKEEPLLTFRKRAIVHFAVSTEEVFMTTELQRKDTIFLPFNMGNDGGKGNPPNPEGYPVSYLWERILQKDTFLEIIGKYVHLEKKEPDSRKLTENRKEKLIFPRFHQWDCVTKLIAATKDEGPGHRYLVQHSAGSGKTNSISWLTHQLASLHDDENRKIFDSVIIITDRNVLDMQLQESIYQIEHKSGVIAKITGERASKSSQLSYALASGKLIIIVTIQTFPFVMEEIRSKASLKNRNFAIVADEAHSSQTGSIARKLKQILSSEQIDRMELNGEIEEIDVEDVLAAQARGGVFPPNVSYYAFTATPKGKTLELFGRPPDGSSLDSDTRVPFHVYTMEQAIEEGFILDVLKNYTPYKLAFRLAHNGRDLDEKQVDEEKGLKSLMRWVRLHPYNISQKVQIIVEHFRENVMWRIDGMAKAMVVTGSRKEAVRYKIAMEHYIKEKNYRDIGVLVAFSGDVADPESGPDQFNEHNMNPGLRGRDIRDAFDTAEYQVILVANKFQTGFDQPLLMAMYVDKKLYGITAVQTLSRLNRTYPGKETTFILDFVNEPSDILAAFLPYYKKAELLMLSDPNVLNDLQVKLDASMFYSEKEVDDMVYAYIDLSSKQANLAAIIDPIAIRIRKERTQARISDNRLRMKEIEMFIGDMRKFIRAYDFLSQIVDYGGSDLEKRSIFYRCLIPKLIGDSMDDEIDLSRVIMTHYNLSKQKNQDLNLGKASEEGDALRPVAFAGSGSPHDPEKVYISELIKELNELFEGELTDADVINYTNSIRDKVLESPTLRKQAMANTKDRLIISPDFEREFTKAVIGQMGINQKMSEQILNDREKRLRFSSLVIDLIYKILREPDKNSS